MSEDVVARTLYSEYRDEDVGYSWYALPEEEKTRWRRVADYIARVNEDLLAEEAS